MSVLAKRLKKLRTENQMSQEELGKILGLSKSTISLYESGRREPDYETLKQISEHFSCTIDYLLGNDSQTPEQNIEAAVTDDPELLEFWHELVKRDDLQLLFKQVKPLSPASIKKIVRIIKAIEDEESGM